VKPYKFLAEYNSLMSAADEVEYQRLLDEFKTPNKHPKVAVQYIENTWLTPWRKKLVAY
jgi:hypothetical protein